MVNWSLLQCKCTNHKEIVTWIKFAEAQSLIASAPARRRAPDVCELGGRAPPAGPGRRPSLWPFHHRISRVGVSLVGFKGCTNDPGQDPVGWERLAVLIAMSPFTLPRKWDFETDKCLVTEYPPLGYRLNYVSPKLISWSPNPQPFRMWLSLETMSFFLKNLFIYF